MIAARSCAALAAAALMAIASCASGPRVGGPAPAFTAVDAGGETVSLASLRGGVVILDFWALW